MDRGLKQVLDYSDYRSAPDDGQRYEIIAGDWPGFEIDLAALWRDSEAPRRGRKSRLKP